MGIEGAGEGVMKIWEALVRTWNVEEEVRLLTASPLHRSEKAAPGSTANHAQT